MATPEPKSESDDEAAKKYLEEVELKIGKLPDFRENFRFHTYTQPELGEGFYGLWDDETIVRGEE